MPILTFSKNYLSRDDAEPPLFTWIMTVKFGHWFFPNEAKSPSEQRTVWFDRYPHKISITRNGSLPIYFKFRPLTTLEKRLWVVSANLGN